MTSPATPPDVPAYQRSARADLRIWLLFIVGVMFAWAGFVVDPATNCDDSGNCAPWLVPVAKWLGVVFGTLGFGQLLFNPRRGSRIDPVSGELVWWQKRLARAAGEEGHIHPLRIGRIRIVRRSEGDDEVHLYDLDGVRQHHFDAEVIPWPYERWARTLAARWPQIEVDVEG